MAVKVKSSQTNMEGYYFFNGEQYGFYNGQFKKVEGEDVNVPETSRGLLVTDEVERRIKYIQGKVLTVIDAVYADREQKKAIKDIINQIISTELNSLSDSATGFKTLSEGDMVQFAGSEEKFLEEQVEPVLVKGK